MVRGEELIDLLNLIVRFLVAHVHPVPGTPPVPVATDGTQSTQILFELQNAVNKILEEYPLDLIDRKNLIKNLNNQKND